MGRALFVIFYFLFGNTPFSLATDRNCLGSQLIGRYQTTDNTFPSSFSEISILTNERRELSVKVVLNTRRNQISRPIEGYGVMNQSDNNVGTLVFRGKLLVSDQCEPN